VERAPHRKDGSFAIEKYGGKNTYFELSMIRLDLSTYPQSLVL